MEFVIAGFFFLSALSLLLIGIWRDQHLMAIAACFMLITGMWVHLTIVCLRHITYQVAMLQEVSPTIVNIMKFLRSLMGGKK